MYHVCLICVACCTSHSTYYLNAVIYNMILWCKMMCDHMSFLSFALFYCQILNQPINRLSMVNLIADVIYLSLRNLNAPYWQSQSCSYLVYLLNWLFIIVLYI
jgi:hypothetical protein